MATGISLVREQTEAMRLPRFLWVPFELGRPFGAPHEPDFQRRVLRNALALLDRTDEPVVLADFPDDAPTGHDEAPWACPVSYAPATVEEPELLHSVRTEVAQLAPWAELGSTPAANTGLALGEMIDQLATMTNHAGDAPVEIEQVRLVADDLRTWYLHAVAQQPGRASSHERNNWFWRETALAHLLGQVAAALLNHHDQRVRAFARQGIVPRDHQDLLIPDQTLDEPEA